MKQIIFWTSFMVLFLFHMGQSQNGNVGIGTDNPQAKLHVDGDVRIDDKTDFNNTSGQTFFLIDPENGQMKLFNEAGEEVMVLELTSASNFSPANNNSESSTGSKPIQIYKSGSREAVVSSAGIQILNTDENKESTLFPGLLNLANGNKNLLVGSSFLQFVNENNEEINFTVSSTGRKVNLDAELCVDEIKVKKLNSSKEVSIMPEKLKAENTDTGESTLVTESEIKIEDTNSGDNVSIKKNQISMTNNSSGCSHLQNSCGISYFNAFCSSNYKCGSNTIQNSNTGAKNEQTPEQNAITDGNGNENTATAEKNRVEDSNSGKYSQMDKNKVASGDNSKASLIDCIGFLNSKITPFGTAGLSLDHSGLFNFDGNGSVGFTFDIPQESIDFFADIFVNGEISANVKNFRIDHPLDPLNKVLQHVSVESPDMKTIYDGTITSNNNGIAIVQLPEYFESLNIDFRYQLTVIGSFSQAIISKEISNNQFEIQTNEPNVKVSWQVTGIRNDTYAKAKRVQVEMPKTGEEVGQLLFNPNSKRTLPIEVKENFEKRTKN